MKNKTYNFLTKTIFSPSISVIISLSLVLFVLGLLGLVVLNAKQLSNYMKENIGFSIMIKESASDLDVLKFQKELEGYNFVKSTRFISKEKATKDLKESLGEDFVQFLGYSPLLASIDVKLNADYANNDSLNIVNNELTAYNLVHEVFYQKDIVEKLNRNTKKISFLLIIFSFLLFTISFVLINNTIRLSVYSKRFLIRTMKLVGATNLFIQKPFLSKGVYQGLYSSIYAIFMLMGTIKLIQSETANMLSINNLKIIGFVFLLVFFIGILISSCATYLAVKKYIKLNEQELYK